MLKNLHLPALTAFRISARLTAKNLHFILESMPSLVELQLGCEVAEDDIWYRPDNDDDRFPDPLSKYAPNVQHLVIQNDTYIYVGEPTKEFIDNLFSSSWLQLGDPTNNVRTLEVRTTWDLAPDLRREMDVKLAQNPIDGLKVAVVANNEPLLWVSSTLFDKSAAKRFDETNFGGHQPHAVRVTRADSEEY
jgi:hypothetical protein